MSLRWAAALCVLSAAGAARAEPPPEKPIVVHVSGHRHGPPASRRDPTAASMLLRGEDLHQPGATSAEVLSQVPGVQVAQSGSGSDLATASIRGATSAETPVYLAGIRLNDDVTGTADLSTVPLWMLDRVEVFRGNAPEAADRLGIGGAIFFEPRLPHHSRLGGGYALGSFGELSTWLGGAVAAPGAASMVALSRSYAKNDYTYVNDNGTRSTTADDRAVRRPNADATSYDSWAIGRTTVGPGGAGITTLVNAFDREQGVTGAGLIPAEAARAHTRRLLAGITARVPCHARRPGEPAGDCRIELTSSAISAGNTLSDPLRELALAGTRVSSTGQRFSQQVRLIRELGDRVRVSLDGDEEAELLRVDTPGAQGLHAERQVSRGAGSLAFQAFDWLELYALGALECHSTSGPDGADHCGVLEPSGRLGARLLLAPGVSLLANVGRFVRVPTLGELYGTSPQVRGNSALQPELGYGGDLGVRAETSRSAPVPAWVDAFGFLRSVSQLIAFRRSGLGYVRPFNVGRARVLGAELAAGADLFHHIRSTLALTALDPRDTTRTEGNNLIPFQSRLATSGLLELYTEPQRSPLDRVGLGARASYRSSRVADPAGLIIIDQQALLDLQLMASFQGRRLAARLAVRNVTGARHFDVVGYPLPGRSVHASLEAWWR
jgi:iron complex outermembrane receptor protein